MAERGILDDRYLLDALTWDEIEDVLLPLPVGTGAVASFRGEHVFVYGAQGVGQRNPFHFSGIGVL